MASILTRPEERVVMTRLASRYDDTNSYLKRPSQWASDKLAVTHWSAQRRLCESVVEHRYTACHSAHDLGKTKVAADIGAWWLDSHALGEAFLVSTAPTAAQVSAILWREIGKNHRIGGLPGRITMSGYPRWSFGGELIGYGRKPADYEESAFQGIHAKYVLIIIDEAGGVAQHLYNAIDALATNEHARVLAIGNPDDPGSHFAAICKPDSDWHVEHLDGLRSPNMSEAGIIGNGTSDYPEFPLLAALMRSAGVPFSTEAIPDEVRPYLLSPLWAEERIRRWAGVPKGTELSYAPDELEQLVARRCAASSLVQAKLRGVFPSSTATGVIPLGWVQQAINRWKDWQFAGADISKVPNPTARTLGIDVAYGGEDETAIAVRYGDCIPEIHRYRHADTIETAEAASAWLQETGSVAVVDVIGIGAGVYDQLRRYRRDNVIQARSLPFNASAATPRTDFIGEFKFRNDRAAAWWKMREMLDPSRGSKIMLPDDERMLEELVAVKYKLLAGGVIQIESKDDIRKRLGRSTDTADAVIQSFWPDGLSANWDNEGGNGIPYSNDEHKRTNSPVVEWEGYTPVTASDMLASPGYHEDSSVVGAVALGLGIDFDPLGGGWDLDV